MTDPLISVVLPVHNGERYLRPAIRSIQDQTFRDWELLIIDDASTDFSHAIAQKSADTDSRIRVFQSEHNLRLPGALNFGFEHARGEFWTWTSDDNEYMPVAFERMLEVIRSTKDCGLVYADFVIIDPEGRPQGTRNLKEPDNLIYGNCIGACFLYSREMALRVGSYDPSLELVEDYHFWLRLSQLASIHHIPEILYRYRTHEDSLTGTRESEACLLDVQMRQNFLDQSQITHSARYARSLYKRLFLFKYRTLRIPNLWNQWPLLFILFFLEDILREISRPVLRLLGFKYNGYLELKRKDS